MFVFFLCSFCLLEPHFFITNLLKYTIKVILLKHILHWLLVYSSSCATVKKKLLFISSHSPFPLLKAWEPTNVSLNLPILYISYKWNHTTDSPFV